MSDALNDGLVDDTGFGLGLPTYEEMLKHQADILCSDLELTRRNLRAAHRELAGLIVMYRGMLKEVATLNAENERLRRTLSDIYLRESQEATSKMGYAYGDYSKK
ncbi:hypothetical protein [Pseudomonas beijingensis]|uniref:hypothetical protein n=1 Tax=Pseudomonas beijingensis TaxID=2954101 RepID=UPI00273501C9|nr:hypothetical protein [Pseudomonas sp. FP2262]WLH44225.1 hypothetical protein PSH83_17745 [Pseudomonas sp. FP2262]